MRQQPKKKAANYVLLYSTATDQLARGKLVRGSCYQSSCLTSNSDIPHVIGHTTQASYEPMMFQKDRRRFLSRSTCRCKLRSGIVRSKPSWGESKPIGIQPQPLPWDCMDAMEENALRPSCYDIVSLWSGHARPSNQTDSRILGCVSQSGRWERRIEKEKDTDCLLGAL